MVAISSKLLSPDTLYLLTSIQLLSNNSHHGIQK